MSLEWSKTEHGNPFVGAAGVWPELRRRNLFHLSWRERRERKEKAGEKMREMEPGSHIYILPKLQIQPYNYLNHLKFPQITTKYLYSPQLIFIKQSTPKVILKIHIKT